MEKLFDRVRPYLVLVSLFLLVLTNSGCAAATLPVNYQPPLDSQAIGIQVGTVAYGIRQCLADKAGTMILVRDGQYLFVWFYESTGAGMFGLDTSKGMVNIVESITSGGAFTNASSAQDLTKWMLNNGWTAVTGASFSQAAKTLLLSTVESVSSKVLLTLYIVVPANTGFPEWQNIPNLGDNLDEPL